MSASDRFGLGALAAAAGEALSWLLPVDCAGCGEPDVSLCATCRAIVREAVPCRRIVGGLVVTSATSYEGPIVGVMRALKSEGRTALARPVGQAMGRVVRAVLADERRLPPNAPRAVPVAIPSTSEAFRRRGYRVVELLVRHAGLSCAPLLRARTDRADQRALGREERLRNSDGMFTLRAATTRPVLLIDDVVTTGSTLLSAARTLETAGVEVVGAVTFASTPLHRGPLSCDAQPRLGEHSGKPT